MLIDDLVNVWSLWADQNLPKTYVLYGLDITTWARIGKVLESISILIVIIEIFGVDRINEVSDTADRLLEKTRDFLKDNKNKIFIIGSIITAGIFFIGIFIDVPWRNEGFFEVIKNSLGLLILSIIIGSITFAMLISIPAMIMSILDNIIIKPLIFLLSSTNLMLIIRLLTLITFMIGFHFSLLAT